MKICSKCKLEKSLEDFNKNHCRKDGYQTFCRECGKKRSKQYYRDNKDHHVKVIRERNDSIRSQNQVLLCEYLLQHPCKDCKETDILVLEFDHLRDKTHHVSTLLGGAHPWTTIEKEIEKCEVVCGNCHKRRTAKRNPNYRIRFLSV